ncbi:pentapeptide repeat-containing protein [Micromonospora sp. NBC_01796]|uniref:pentapeptide repeat-containing protein n=1 Tax=Micromonospora sp. NBC_01796 TaxID=2975987 RepID=UPI003FA3AC17
MRQSRQIHRPTFSGSAGFPGVTFNDDAGFAGATFNGNAWFHEATFNGCAQLSATTFSSANATWFVGAGVGPGDRSRDAWPKDVRVDEASRKLAQESPHVSSPPT